MVEAFFILLLLLPRVAAIGSVSVPPPSTMTLSEEVPQSPSELQSHLDALHGKLRENLDVMYNCQENENKIKCSAGDVGDEAGTENIEIVEHKTRREHRPLPTGVKNTTWCSLCDFTCHDNSDYADNADKAKCSAMNRDGQCKRCPAECHWTAYKNVPYIVVNVPYTVKTMKTMKEPHRGDGVNNNNNAEPSHMRGDRLVVQLQLQYCAAFREAQQCVSQMKSCIERLKAAGITVSVKSEAEYISMLIRSEETKKEAGWHARVTSLKELQCQAECILSSAQQSDAPQSQRHFEAGVTALLPHPAPQAPIPAGLCRQFSACDLCTANGGLSSPPQPTRLSFSPLRTGKTFSGLNAEKGTVQAFLIEVGLPDPIPSHSEPGSAFLWPSWWMPFCN